MGFDNQRSHPKGASSGLAGLYRLHRAVFRRHAPQFELLGQMASSVALQAKPYQTKPDRFWGRLSEALIQNLSGLKQRLFEGYGLYKSSCSISG